MAAKRKLHEFLGSQKQLFGQAEKVRTDLIATFSGKKHLFAEKLVKFTPAGENVKEEVETQSKIQTTIPQELKWLQSIIAKAFDSEATIDTGNTLAKADVTLDDGTTILTGVPATQLLQLDKRLGELHQFVTAIPTLDPAKGFIRDANRQFTFIAAPVRKNRTAKKNVPITLAPATDKHPAQVQLVTEDVVTGTIEEQEWSGLITPVLKATLLERVEELRRAVKQARARANDVLVEEVQIGNTLLDYVFAPAYEQK